MKILMITPYLPYPPSSGGQVRSYNLLCCLARKHQIVLLSLIKDPSERQYVKKLEKYCQKVWTFTRSPKPWTLKNVLRTGFGFHPFLVVRNFSHEARKAVKNLLDKEKFDLIHAETFYVMPHIPPTKTPILLVEQTIEYQVYAHFVNSLSPFLFFLKPFLYIDVFKLKWWEKFFWKKADLVVAVSESDKKKMEHLVKDLKVSVVPNGAGEDLMAVWKKRKPSKIPIVFFQANFSWLQNVEAARILVKKVFPLIKRQIPKVKCWIVGQGVKEKIGSLKARGVKIVDLSTGDIKGVINAYRKASVFVAPLRGPGGTRLKILAAMAAGVPVVTTSIGIEGIDAQNEKQVLIANHWEKMARKTCLLINQKKLYQKITRAARKLVETRYSYRSISSQLDKIYQKVAYEKKN